MARNTGSRGARNKPTVIDFHAHFMTPEVFEATYQLSVIGRLRCEYHAVHRTDSRGGTSDRYAPIRLPYTVEDAECDERVEFIEAFEGQYGDVHGGISVVVLTQRVSY